MDTSARRQARQYEGLHETLKKVHLKNSPGSFRGEAELERVVGYLNAGFILLFGDGREAPVAPHNFSVEAVAKKAQRETSTGSSTDFYTLWGSVDDHVEDILLYSVWVGHWKSHFQIASDAEIGLAKPGSGLSHAIHEVAYRDFRVSMQSAQISLIASAFAARNPGVQKAATKVYAEIHKKWGEVYSSILKARKLRLRDDMTIDRLAIIITAQSDGIVALKNSVPDADVIDHGRRRTLLGEAILFIVAGAVEKENSHNPTSIISIVDGLLR